MGSLSSERKRFSYYLEFYKKHFLKANYCFFSCALVVGLSTGKIIMSIASIALFANWLLEGNFNAKLEHLKQHKNIFWLLVFGYLSLLFWLINTSNFTYAFNDLKVKVPLLLFPLILGTVRFSAQSIKLIFKFFILGTLVSTIISFLVYLEIIPIEKSLDDIRSISIFISHIRLSLLICFSIVSLVYFKVKKIRILPVLMSPIIILWFIYFLFLIQVFTGVLILFFLILFFIIYVLVKQKKYGLGILGLLVIIGAFLYTINKVNEIYQNHFITEKIEISSLDEYSKSGELYEHYPERTWLENGNYVWRYIASRELQKEWDKRSVISFNGFDKKDQPLYGTLYRYLTSKNLRKDKEGLASLSDSEIRLIESGVTNCCEKLTGVDKRIKTILFQVERAKNNQDPNGHAMTQRIAYINAGLDLIKENFFSGVGLGDTHDAFLNYYEVNHSKLKGNNRKRVHNQFLVFGVTLGILGFIIWIGILYFPLVLAKKNSFLYGCFMLIITVSFFTDNTLERQAGVMFFAFFNSLLIFQKELK